MGSHTIAPLTAASHESLIRSLGSLGEHLFHLSRGKDNRPVVPNWEAKSIGSETTFDVDTDDRELLLRTILELSDHVAERLRKDGYRARRVTLKLRYSNFSTHTKQSSLDKFVQTGEEIAEVARRLFAKFSLKQKIRLIGVSVGDLHRDGADPQQLPLFSQSNDKEKLS